MTDLKPCPFCGGEAGIYVMPVVNTALANGCITIGCSKCKAQTLGMEFQFFEDISGLIGAASRRWGQRPEPLKPEEFEGTYYCGECGGPVSKTDKFCHECGKELGWDG